MPELDVSIGGKVFQVSCQPGEETFLLTAAGILDAEAAPLAAQGGRMPESRLLLMAGLMLADRMAGVEEQLRTSLAKIAELEARPEPEPERIEIPVEIQVEIPVIPQPLIDRVALLAAEAESLADLVEERAARIADLEG